MSRTVAVTTLLLLALASAAQASEPLLEMVRLQADLDRRLLAAELTQVERNTELLRAASVRLIRLSEDLVRAERDGEEVASLDARGIDLVRAEAEVAELITVGRQLRTQITTRRTHLEQLELELRRLEDAARPGRDEVSGRWQVAVEPGAGRGTFDLRLEGTLITGTYQLEGGWKGSLRGTLVGGTLRLERIDSQLGFAAVYHARLVTRDGERRLEGTWDATNLSAGMTPSGTWVGRRVTARP